LTDHLFALERRDKSGGGLPSRSRHQYQEQPGCAPHVVELPKALQASGVPPHAALDHEQPCCCRHPDCPNWLQEVGVPAQYWLGAIPDQTHPPCEAQLERSLKFEQLAAFPVHVPGAQPHPASAPQPLWVVFWAQLRAEPWQDALVPPLLLPLELPPVHEAEGQAESRPEHGMGVPEVVLPTLFVPESAPLAERVRVSV